MIDGERSVGATMITWKREKARNEETVSETRVTHLEACDIDFMESVGLVRRDPWERKRFYCG